MGIVDENGDFENSRIAFSADGVATIFGALLGLSPVTSYIESGAGVTAGSRTGLTAVFCGIFFMLSLFFAPIIASIPPWASGGALIIVGSIMCRSLQEIKWHNPTHAITAFLTVIVMPLTYSIAYGLIAGIGTYVVAEGVFMLLGFLGIPKPEYEDESEGNLKSLVDEDPTEEVEVEKPKEREIPISEEELEAQA
jgi:adenine/guanine/hypoxanthine permease